MKKLSPEEIVQLCLNSLEDARPYLDRDMVIELATIAHEQSFSDPERALEIAECALAMAEIVDDMLARAWAIWAKGVVHSSAHYYHKALPLYERAEDIFIKYKQWLPLAEVQVGLIYVLKECGRLVKALQKADKVRPLCCDLGKDGLLSLGLLEMNIGSMHRQQGQLDLALEAYARAMQAYEQTGGPFRIARIKINSANVYLQMDQYQQAEALYYEARALLLQVTPQPQELSLVDSNLSLLAEKLGHYQKALHHLEQARDGFIPEARIHSVDLKRANIYNRLNLNKESLILAQGVTDYYAKTEQFIYLAQALRAQAIALCGLGRLEEARTCFVEAREIFAEQDVRQEIVSIDLLLAELALDEDDLKEARWLASQLADSVDGDLWPHLTVQVYLLQTRILLWISSQREGVSRARLHNANRALQQALRFTKSHPQPRIMIDIYRLLSQLHILRGEDKAAWSALCQAMTYLETIRDNLFLDEFRICLMDELHAIYHDGLELLQNCTLFDVGPDRQAQFAAMFYLLNRAATAPFVQMDRGAHSSPRPNEKLQDKLDELRELWHDQQCELIESQIVDLRRRLRIWKDWEESTTPILSELADSDNMPNNASDLQFQEQSVHFYREIQQRLGPHEALLHYFVADEQVYLLVVSHTEICHYALGSEDPIDDFRERWQSYIKRPAQFYIMPQASHKKAQSILLQPGQLLLEPFLGELTDIDHLYLIYPTEWHDIPFAALRTIEGYLVERFQLTHLSTPEALLHSISLSRSSNAQSPSTDSQPHALIIGCSDNGRLPRSLQEGHQVEARLSQAGWDTTLLLEEDATRENFDSAISQSQLLHLATHASSNPDNPLFSWILLYDDPLIVADIYHQTPLLNQALVVLSACQTGRGQARSGGLLGMARAWLVSGARGLVASLWEVDDQATAQLMEYFYERIENSATPITSNHLCQAQRRLATTRHPFFWAAFIYVAG